MMSSMCKSLTTQKGRKKKEEQAKIWAQGPMDIIHLGGGSDKGGGFIGPYKIPKPQVRKSHVILNWLN